LTSGGGGWGGGGGGLGGGKGGGGWGGGGLGGGKGGGLGGGSGGWGGGNGIGGGGGGWRSDDKDDEGPEESSRSESEEAGEQGSSGEESWPNSLPRTSRLEENPRKYDMLDSFPYFLNVDGLDNLDKKSRELISSKVEGLSNSRHAPAIPAQFVAKSIKSITAGLEGNVNEFPSAPLPETLQLSLICTEAKDPLEKTCYYVSI